MEKDKRLIDFLPQTSLKALTEEIGQIREGTAVFYWSKNWSMHELVLYLLSQTGPADMCISSFSVSEEAVRAFALARDTGHIRSLKVLFDYTTKKHKTDFVNFIHNVADSVRTCPNHSKGVLLEGNIRLAVLSSQNLNRNYRIECGAVTAAPQEFEKLKAKFSAFYGTATPLWNIQENS